MLPLVGAVAVMLLPAAWRQQLPKQVALGVSLVTLVLVARWRSVRDRREGFQFERDPRLDRGFGVYYAVGVDGIGLT